MNAVLPSLATALAELYERAEEALPSVEQCITPLSALVGAYNLTCSEVEGLNSRKVSTWLLRQSAILDPLDEATDEALAGFLYAEPRYGALFVERGDRLVRRRFSVAHELGHYLLHFRPMLLVASQDGDHRPVGTDAQPRATTEDPAPDDLPIGKPTIASAYGVTPSLPSIEQMEREANQFAADLLMPEDVVREVVKRHRRTYRGEDLVWRLATDMLVSKAAMRWRLLGLGLLSTTLPWN